MFKTIFFIISLDTDIFVYQNMKGLFYAAAYFNEVKLFF